MANYGIPSIRGLLSPEERQAAMFQGLLNVGPLLMAAGAPTNAPGYSARALTGIGPAWQDAQNNAVDQKFAGMQMQGLLDDQQRNQQINDTVQGLITPDMDPNQAAYAQLFPEQYLSSMFAPGEGFTLGENDVRYDANGNVIASGPQSNSRAETVLGRDLGYTGKDADALFEVKYEGDRIVDYNRLSAGSDVSVTVPIDLTEDKFNTEYGGNLADMASAVLTNADMADQQISNIQQMRYLVGQWRQAGGETGQLANTSAMVSSWMQTLGMDPTSLGLPADAGPAQALQALSNSMTLGKIGGEGGMPANNFSDADRAFIMSTNPQLQDTPSGFEAKLLIAERAAERTRVKEQMWIQARSEGKSFETFRQEWRDYVNRTPLLTEQDKNMIEAAKSGGSSGGGGSGGIPSIADEAAYNALPSGTQYYDPNGVLRTKQ